jgi:hypothetical protein
MKAIYIEAERQECWNVMFGEIPNSEIVHLNHWKISFNNQYLSDVQDYIERTIKNGIDDGLGFIHSPNCKYQDTSRPDSRIYAKFVWDYFKWLKSFIVKNEKGDSSIPNLVTEPKNIYPFIFKNGFAYEMFIELKTLTVKQETFLSDYAFIFHKMKNFEFIGKDVKHKAFIDILNKDFDADIAAKKLPYKNQEAKKIVFSTLFNKYNPLIESVA